MLGSQGTCFVALELSGIGASHLGLLNEHFGLLHQAFMIDPNFSNYIGFAVLLDQSFSELNGVGRWLNGPPTSISAHNGKVLVVVFFADKYEPCQFELKALEGVSKQLSGGGASIIGLTKFYRSLDKTPAEVQAKNLDAFLDKHGVTFPVGIAKDFSNLKAYGGRGIPHTVVIDKSGNIAYVKTGSSQRNQRALADLVAAIRRAM